MLGDLAMVHAIPTGPSTHTRQNGVQSVATRIAQDHPSSVSGDLNDLSKAAEDLLARSKMDRVDWLIPGLLVSLVRQLHSFQR